MVHTLACVIINIGGRGDAGACGVCGGRYEAVRVLGWGAESVFTAEKERVREVMRRDVMLLQCELKKELERELTVGWRSTGSSLS